MKTIVDTLVGNPVLLAAAVILSVLILIAFFRRIFRLLMVAAALFVLYAAWMTWRGEEVMKPVEQVRRSVEDGVRKGQWVMKMVEEVLKLVDRAPEKDPV